MVSDRNWSASSGSAGRPAGKPLTGFTLIELLLVVLIISITLGLSAPLFRKTFYGLELDLCAEDIAGYMRYIRERSIVEGVPMKFVLDAKEKEYWLEKKDVESGEYARVKGKYGGSSVSDDVEIESQGNIIYFYPDGSFSSAEIAMINPNKKKLVISVKRNKVKIIDDEKEEQGLSFD
ncbi:MAG: prepilin-type N-terminal cleavage/methylation domain-containing protein [Candidatus Omnitrophota bacterium]